MSRGFTPRHAQTAGDLGFAMEFNAETPWHFAQVVFTHLKLWVAVARQSFKWVKI